MITSTPLGYIAVNKLGVPVKSWGTSPRDLTAARDWVKSNAYLHDGLELREQTLSARRIYKPRFVQQPPRDDFAIPPCTTS